MFKELQTCECGDFFLKPIISEIYDCLIFPRGYPADDLCMPVQTAQSNGIRLYSHIRVCPDKAAQIISAA